MLRWFDRSHPQTMQAAVFIGYLSGVFGLLGGPGPFGLGLLSSIAMLGGAFGMANNKRIGWAALAGGSGVYVLLRLLVLVDAVPFGVNPILLALNALVFPVALLAAVLHPHTRVYMKTWFE